MSGGGFNGGQGRPWQGGRGRSQGYSHYSGGTNYNNNSGNPGNPSAGGHNGGGNTNTTTTNNNNGNNNNGFNYSYGRGSRGNSVSSQAGGRDGGNQNSLSSGDSRSTAPTNSAASSQAQGGTSMAAGQRQGKSPVAGKVLPCQKCNSTSHIAQNCKERLYCEICLKNTHITEKCVWPTQPKPVIQLVGFAAKELGCFFAQNTRKIGPRTATGAMAIVHIKRGTPSAAEIEIGLGKSIQVNWEWKVREVDKKRYLVRFPSTELLDRLQNFDDFTLKGTGISVAISRWSSASLAKAKLHSVWVKITGIPDELMHYRGLCEAGSPLGVVQEVDMAALIKFSLARVRVGVRDPAGIPLCTEVTTDPYIYDAFYELESIAEIGGMLDVDGLIIGSARKEPMDCEQNRDPKRNRAGGDPGGSSSNNLVVVDNASNIPAQTFTREEMDMLIQEELDRKMAVQLQQLEERAYAAAMAKFNEISKKTDTIDDSVHERTNIEVENVEIEDINEEEDKDNADEEIEYESSQDLQSKVDKASRGEDPYEKTYADDIRKRLRPQDDGTILDKARDLANKKNLGSKEIKGVKGAAARS